MTPRRIHDRTRHSVHGLWPFTLEASSELKNPPITFRTSVGSSEKGECPLFSKMTILAAGAASTNCSACRGVISKSARPFRAKMGTLRDASPARQSF